MVSELEERKEMLLKDRSKYEVSLLKGIKSERVQRLSNARSERKRRLLLKRKEMIDSLLDGVKAYTKEFVKTDGYITYIEKTIKQNIRKIKSMGEIIIYLKEDDLLGYQKNLEELLLNENIESDTFGFEIYEGRIIGGVIIVKKDKSLRLDMSLDSVIVDNREYMGQLIYGILEEAGETNGK
jgi:vacuolar-type H+-ATPase subunit E/Vma4